MAYSLKDAVRYLWHKEPVDKDYLARPITKLEREIESEKNTKLERMREQEIFFWGVFPIL